MIQFADQICGGTQALEFRRGGEGPVDFLVARMRSIARNQQVIQAVLFVVNNFRFDVEFRFIDGFGQLFQGLLVLEIRFLFQVARGENVDKLAVREAF